MGQIIVTTALSVDGYADGPGDDISGMALDESLNEQNAERIARAARVRHGANTYRRMVGYWPEVPNNPDASVAERRIAARMAEGLPVPAVSDPLTNQDPGPVGGPPLRMIG